MHRKVVSCLVVLFFLGAATSWADVGSVKSLLAGGENQRALAAAQAMDTQSPEIKHLIALAKLRLANQRSIANPEAAMWLPGEREEIEGLLGSAADQGYGPAMFDYGIVLSNGAEAWSEATFFQLDRALTAGEPMAALTLYHMYCAGETIPIEISKIEPRVIEISKMLTSGETSYLTIYGEEDAASLAEQAKMALAENLATGSCGRLDKTEARRIFDSMAAEPDQLFISWSLGSIVDQFKGTAFFGQGRFPVEANPFEAFDWLAYKVRTGRGAYSDYMDLAEALLTGTGTAKNFTSAASAVAACYREQKIRENIFCFPYTVDEAARDVLKASASSGLRPAERGALESIVGKIAIEEASKDGAFVWIYAESLGDAYYDGTFGAPDFSKALSFYRVAAAKGAPSSQYSLGYMYSNGEGAKVNPDEAIKFYSMAASNGVSAAAHNLGWLYAASGIVPKDDVQATDWYRKAAELGSLDAMVVIADRIANGTGTLENDMVAVRWLTTAAEAGQKSAQYDLAHMYANGEGVDQNFVVAYKWANLAGGQGVDVSTIKSWLSARMTRDDISRAQIISASWKPTPLSEASSNADSSSLSGTSRPPEPDELTLEVQVGLSELGLLTGRADGLYGPKTRAAIEAFQQQQGLPVTGQVSPQLATQIGRALSEAPTTRKRPEDASSGIATGTGFVISASGHLVTNAHVVTGCKKTTLANGKLLTMQAYDPVTDLALLKSSALEGVAPLFLRGGANVEVAESVAVAGFPLSGMVSPDLNVTLGNVSALSGPDGSKSLIQITAPVQPGNSGGPILDEAGIVVGVVVSKLDAIAVATITGDIPQNVNFGIALGELKSFLVKQKVQFATKSETTALKNAEVGKIARASTFQIQCH
jgi:TPR repeat protein